MGLFWFFPHSSPEYDRELADMKAQLKKDPATPSPNIGKNRKSADSKSVNSLDTEPEQGELITVNPSTARIQNQSRVSWLQWIHRQHGSRTRAGWVDYSKSVNSMWIHQHYGYRTKAGWVDYSESINIMDTEPEQDELITVNPSTSWIKSLNRVSWLQWIYQQQVNPSTSWIQNQSRVSWLQ